MKNIQIAEIWSFILFLFFLHSFDFAPVLLPQLSAGDKVDIRNCPLG